ncbi:interleukin-13 receptor subunit alpha-2-like [Narcine bancroftii]|uniref:interleukin-13 receptor subunit alpha-2-like n=1 Tax=Narcine bancroftii TaxID=1343680 RepID=UPI003831B260
MFYQIIYFALSFMLPIALSNLFENLSHINAPTNIRIVEQHLGDLKFSWKNNLPFDPQYHIKYVFEYQYFDSDNWSNEVRLSEAEHEGIFELHRGLYIRIKNILLYDNNKMKESNWTVMRKPPSGDPETLASNVSCVVYNYSYMNCTWQNGIKVPRGIQYKMYYRQEDITTECPHYFTDFEGRQKCHVGENGIELDEHVLICINRSNSSLSIMPYYTDFDPQLFEIYNPPVNFEILPNLTVKWEKPPGYTINDNCFQYQLQLTELSGNNHEFFYVKVDTKFVLVNINLSKRYSVKVRMKLKYCKETMYWSDWSNELFLEPTEQLDGHVMIIALLLLMITAAMLLTLVFRRYKIIASSSIPDPQKKFKELIEEHNGDFQTWIGYHTLITKHEECYTVVVEETIISEA